MTATSWKILSQNCPALWPLNIWHAQTIRITNVYLSSSSLLLNIWVTKFEWRHPFQSYYHQLFSLFQQHEIHSGYIEMLGFTEGERETGGRGVAGRKEEGRGKEKKGKQKTTLASHSHYQSPLSCLLFPFWLCFIPNISQLFYFFPSQLLCSSLFPCPYSHIGSLSEIGSLPHT